jgi:hypothetical protein
MIYAAWLLQHTTPRTTCQDPFSHLSPAGSRSSSVTLCRRAPTPLGHALPSAPIPGRLTADHGRRLPGSPPRSRPGGSPSTSANVADGLDTDHRAPRCRQDTFALPFKPAPGHVPEPSGPAYPLPAPCPAGSSLASCTRETCSLAFEVALRGSRLRGEKRNGFLLGSRPILASEGKECAKEVEEGWVVDFTRVRAYTWGAGVRVSGIRRTSAGAGPKPHSGASPGLPGARACPRTGRPEPLLHRVP